MLAYIAGPMTKYADEGYNYESFNDAARRLRELGYDVLNPAETAGGITHLSKAKFMEIDMGYVAAADAVVILPEWQDSRGAKLEMAIADALSKSVYRYDPETGLGREVQLVGLDAQVQEIIRADGRNGAVPHSWNPKLDRGVV